MTKRRRLNDIESIDHESILDKLDEIPFIYRSIQGIVYMKNNPLTLNEIELICDTSWNSEPSSTVNLEKLISFIFEYIKDVTEKTFRNCGLYHMPNDVSIESDRGHLMIGTPVKECDCILNFGLYIQYLEKMTQCELHKINPLFEARFNAEGSMMFFMIKVTDRAYFDDFVSEKPDDAVDF